MRTISHTSRPELDVGKLTATSEINLSQVIGPARASSRGGVRARIVVKIT